ncbi:muts domain V domain-containing protein [Neurospora intermedia]|uniref:Muts domain V domain-containing protein n=1 Tax=Neurospora intermedia TaxID=5142 RepID=A0ABR3DR31_NEUIN
MGEDFHAHQGRFPRLLSDDYRRRALSGAAIGSEPRHQAFARGSALMDDVVIKSRPPLHTTMIPEPLPHPQLPTCPPTQYNWQDPRGRQVPHGYPDSQSHERYLPDTHGSYALHPVNTYAPHTPISDPRKPEFSYQPGYGLEHNYNPRSNGNFAGASYPYLAFENITATKLWGPGSGPAHITPQTRITESSAISEEPRRDLCSSPYFGNTSASSSPRTHNGRQHRRLPLSRPASTGTQNSTPVRPRRSNTGARRDIPGTPSVQNVHPSPLGTTSSSSYHRYRGEEQGNSGCASIPTAKYSSRAPLSGLKECSGTTPGSREMSSPMISQSSSRSSTSNSVSQRDISESTLHLPRTSLYDRISKTQAMSTRSTLPTPVFSDSDSDSDADESSLEKGYRLVGSSLIIAPQKESAPTVSSEEKDHVICAISESRSAEVVGIAVINITTGQVDLARILNDDKYLYQRLGDTLWKMSSKPEKFLVVNSVTTNSSKSLLISCLEQDFPAVPIVLWGREHWSEAEGLRMIERFALRDHVIALKSDLENNFYTPCALSAVMKYVQNELNIHFASNALRIRYIQPLNTMGIDRTTVASLELLQNTRRATAKNSTLFGILNSTKTPQGHRLLRTTLLQPSTNKEEVVERYESVEELSTNEDLFRELRKALEELVRIDFERVIVWISQEQPNPRQPLEEGVPGCTNQGILLPTHAELTKAEQELNSILMLKKYLSGIGALHGILEVAGCTSRLLRWIRDRFAPEHTEPVRRAMEEMIEDDAAYSKKPIELRNNRMWAIRAVRNSVLGKARRSFTALTKDLNEYFDVLDNQFNDVLGTRSNLHMDSNRRYWLRFDYSDVEREIQPQSDVQKANSGEVSHWKQVSIAGLEMINGTRDKKHFKCQTTELLQRSRAIQLQADIATMQSDRLVIELKGRLQEHSSLMFDISDAIALLDMLCSFTQAATTQDYVRPMITDSMVIKQARHPIVEARTNNYVANDVYSGDQSGRFQVITGGNMSGKSTFIRSVALIQIMAQMGSFVPAQFASISICDRVFARVSTDDAPENNLGTFGVEMRETNVILRQATAQSMIIMDELGRGTSPKDGQALAIAIIEKLIKMKPRVFFATHFTRIPQLLNKIYPRDVLNVHFEGQSQAIGQITQITLPHTLAGGPVQNEDYGIELARCVLPGPIVDKAEEVLKALREGQRPHQSGGKGREARQRKITLALPVVMKQALDSTMDDAALGSYLRRLQTEFTLRWFGVEEGEEDGEAEEVDENAGEIDEGRPEEAEKVMDVGQSGRKRPAAENDGGEEGGDDGAESDAEREGRQKRRKED